MAYPKLVVRSCRGRLSLGLLQPLHLRLSVQEALSLDVGLDLFRYAVKLRVCQGAVEHLRARLVRHD